MKKIIQNLLYPKGTTAKILRGPLQGFRFIITENSGWSPVLGRWETELQYLFSKLIKKGNVSYDLGANNGIHTLLMAKLVGSTGKVISFEPIDDNIKEIESNYSLNNLSNISIADFAVSNYTGTTVFKLGLHNKQGSLTGINNQGGREINVKVTTLDDFIEKGNPAPDFMKIDIEGAESDALSGMEKHFSKVKPMVIVELHSKEQDKKVGEFFKRQGYEVYRLEKNYTNNDLQLKHLKKVKNLDLIWPEPDGIWGTVLAFHPSKKPVV